MARVIQSRIAVYIVNPEERVYRQRFPRETLVKFKKALVAPHKVVPLKVKDYRTVDLDTIKPLTHDINIIILPTKDYILKIKIHANIISIFTSLHPGNGKCSYGIYYPPLTLVRYFLLDARPVKIDDKLFNKLKPEGKALILASMLDIEHPDPFNKLFKKSLKLKLDSRAKHDIIRIVLLKKRQYALNQKGEVPNAVQ